MSTRFLKFDLNAFGYYRLCKNMINEALSVFKINASQYPTSANTHDSLGEAYLKAGQKDEAITSYRKSLDLNPGNDNARAVLQTLVNH
jgi:Flp pilus assembly protein TadD